MAYVDHTPWTFTMFTVTKLCSIRQQRHPAAISEFTMDIQPVTKKSNTVADCLSGVLVFSVYLRVDFSAMAADQSSDPDPHP